MIASRIIGTTITGRILGGVLVLVAALVALLLLSRCSNAELQREIGALNQSQAQATETNRNQTERLRECVEGFTALADRFRIEQNANDAAVLAAERRARQRELARIAEQAERGRIYDENPDCEQWGVQRVCLEIGDRMRANRRALIDRYQGESDE